MLLWIAVKVQRWSMEEDIHVPLLVSFAHIDWIDTSAYDLDDHLMTSLIRRSTNAYMIQGINRIGILYIAYDL